MAPGEVWIYDPAPGSLSSLVLLVLRVSHGTMETLTLHCSAQPFASNLTLEPGSTWTWFAEVASTRGWSRVAP